MSCATASSDAPQDKPGSRRGVETTKIEVLGALLAKLTAAGVAAKAAAGVTVAAAAVAGAGAAGMLPAVPGTEHSERPATVVEQLEAEQVEAEQPDTEQADTEQADAARVDAAQEPADATGGEAADEGTPAPQASFGQGVATDARDGGVDGQAVAEQAKANGTDRTTGPANRPEQPTRPEQAEERRGGAPSEEPGRP